MDLTIDKNAETSQKVAQPSIIHVVLQREQGDTKFVDKSKPKGSSQKMYCYPSHYDWS